MDKRELKKISSLAHALNGHYVSHFIRCYQLFNGDLESCIVLGEIAFYNSTEVFNQFAEVGVNDEIKHLLKGCNSFSISMTTGIPRETVRRKVKKLQALGLITSNDKNQLVITKKPGTEMNAFTMETLEIFSEFIEKMKPHL